MSDARKWYEFDPEVESINEHHDRMLEQCPLLDGAEMEVLLQLRQIRWDGDVASKTGRDSLVRRGLAVRYNGYQVVTQEGMAVLEVLGRLAEMEKRG